MFTANKFLYEGIMKRVLDKRQQLLSDYFVNIIVGYIAPEQQCPLAEKVVPRIFGLFSLFPISRPRVNHQIEVPTLR